VSCQETQDLLHGYVDGELDLVRTLQIEQHLRECPACARAYAHQQALCAALRAGSLYFMPPPHLRPRVRTAVRCAMNAATRRWG
jgi:anti-sigma factor RsiW